MAETKMTERADMISTGGGLAKLLDRTPGGLEVRSTVRKTDAWQEGGEGLGKAGYWLGDSEGPVEYVGRTRVDLGRRMGEALALEGAEDYLDRRDRLTHPEGEFDSGGRWYPSAEEYQKCCRPVRSPSRAWPYSYMMHCRTAAHVAALYGAEAKLLKRYARRLDEAFDEGGSCEGRSGMLDRLPAAARALLLGVVVAGEDDAVLRVFDELAIHENLLADEDDAPVRQEMRRVLVLSRFADPEILDLQKVRDADDCAQRGTGDRG